MNDAITIQRIQLMHPNVRKEVLDAYTHINNKLLGKGVRLRFAYTLRTFAEQDALYSIGRTKLYDANGKRLGKVTNAKAGQSIHNYCLAFDVVLLLDKNNDGNFETASWDTVLDYDKDNKSDWKEVADYFISLGWEWGGKWKFKDAPHFQKTFGLTWQQMSSKLYSGDYTEEVINGQKIKFINL